jgi:autotransporter-associated beta strand protein
MGPLILSNLTPNTYAGTTTINAGSLNLGFGTPDVTAIPGSLIIGEGVGMVIDSVLQRVSNLIADGATVSVFSTGRWILTGSETITNLNIVSTGIKPDFDHFPRRRNSCIRSQHAECVSTLGCPQRSEWV